MAEQDVHQRGLAGPVLAQQGQHLAARKLERDVVVRQQRPEAPGDALEAEVVADDLLVGVDAVVEGPGGARLAGSGLVVRPDHRGGGRHRGEHAGEAGGFVDLGVLREGRATITEAYASAEGGGIALVNAYIPEYAPASRFNHEPRRVRRLLLHRKQIGKLQAAISREGRTLVCTKLYWDEKGRAKLELALATGKKAHDKREAVAARDWQRDKARLMREKG